MIPTPTFRGFWGKLPILFAESCPEDPLSQSQKKAVRSKRLRWFHSILNSLGPIGIFLAAAVAAYFEAACEVRGA